MNETQTSVEKKIEIAEKYAQQAKRALVQTKLTEKLKKQYISMEKILDEATEFKPHLEEKTISEMVQVGTLITQRIQKFSSEIKSH
ncbi:hypothetical protein [Shouchella shacheensis]|uniref:hypothetical protein n=1 Tax=Shouchella shacheensis TaxID=1649580 RepID=UPI0007401940|nr:hypothetical protein [Shouchella shacheensis]